MGSVWNVLGTSEGNWTLGLRAQQNGLNWEYRFNYCCGICGREWRFPERARKEPRAEPWDRPRVLRGWWEKTEEGWPENEPGEQGHRSQASWVSRRKKWRAVSDVNGEVKQDKDREVPIVLGNWWPLEKQVQQSKSQIKVGWGMSGRWGSGDGKPGTFSGILVLRKQDGELLKEKHSKGRDF